MKRAMTIAVAAALLATMFGSVAYAANDRAAVTDTVVRDVDAADVNVEQVLRRCRHLFGEDELTDMTKERCLELWKRWCNAHPDARLCRRIDTPPHDCRITDRVIDRRCRPDRPVDRPTDRPVDRPTDRPVDRPTDRPVDRPTDRPVDRPSDRPVVNSSAGPEDRPVVGPPETADLDRVRDRDPGSDKEGNDIHFRARRADL
jgi:hypothetical protein